ncbi:hypothetical protein [Geopseudomonas aromaticivorans]
MSEKMYCLATSMKEGLSERFCDGPSPSIDPYWMLGDDLIFEVTPGGAPVLAVESLEPHLHAMSQSMFLALEQAHAEMTGELAQPPQAGHAVNLRALEDLMHRAPWVAHPEFGLTQRGYAGPESHGLPDFEF